MTVKKYAVLILAFVIFGPAVCLCQPARKAKPKLLRDGFVLEGIDGELTEDNNDWVFKFDSVVADDKCRINAGERVELLPSGTLESMIAGAEKGASASYRLWGRVTKYRDKNFIFPVYFLSISRPEPVRAPVEQQPAEPNVNEPGDAVVIPDDVLAMLKPKRRTATAARLTVPPESRPDSILLDRTGFISKPANSDWFMFELDALGRSLQADAFRLLPCRPLQRAEDEQAAEPGPLRFKVTGILTKYKNENYLLLQRATRLYSHGNFGR